MNPVADNPYGAGRINKGLKHFLLGKGLTSIAGIGTLLLVIRGLSVQEFAAYSVLFGLVELLLAATNVGTGQVFTRFVPEIYSQGYHHALRRLIVLLLGLRYAVLGAAVLVLYHFSGAISGWIGLSEWESAFRIYLLVVLFRTVTSTLFQVLEAMLHQGSGQAVLATVTVSRFVLVAIAYSTGNLDLFHLIWLEVLTDFVGAALMSWSLARASRLPSTAAGVDELAWIRRNRSRMVSFGLKGYLQHMIIMPFSGVANRLVVGSQLPGAQVALFGFAQSIFDVMQRFLPAQLFVGLIRPVMAARYAQHTRFTEIQTITNFILKINLALIGFLPVIAFAGGEQALLALTAGKYGGTAVSLLFLMSLLIALESWRHVLDLLNHTVERYGVLVFTNAILGSSLILGIYLLPALGIFALPAANCVGLVVSNLIVLWWLRKTGFGLRHDIKSVIGIGLALTLAIVVAHFSRPYFNGWIVVTLLAMAAYSAGCYFALMPRGQERTFWSKVLVAARG